MISGFAAVPMPGDVWTLTVGGQILTHTVIAGDTAASIRESLAAEINQRADTLATIDGDNIVITALPVGTSLPAISEVGKSLVAQGTSDHFLQKLTLNSDFNTGDVVDMKLVGGGGTTLATSMHTVAAADAITQILNGLGIQNATVSSKTLGSDLLIATSQSSQIDLDVSGNPAMTSGIEFQVATGPGKKLSIIGPGAVTVESADTVNIAEGNVFEFLVIDDGANVFFSLAQVDDPSNTAFVRTAAATASNENHVVFQNLADSTNEGTPAARLDNVRVGFREVVNVKLDGPDSTTADGFAIIDDTTGTFTIAPEEILNVFNGKSPNADWKLTLSNTNRTRDIALNAWNLDLKTGVTASSTTMVDLADAERTPNDSSLPRQSRSTINVDGTGLGTIADVTVELDLVHPRSEDLDVFLDSPEGTRVKLFADLSSTTGRFTLSDDAALAIDQNDPAPTLTTPVRPQNSLAQFVGENPDGEWTLLIADDQFDEVGKLNGWSLSIATAEPNVIGAADRNVVVAREGLLLDIDMNVDFAGATDDQQPAGLILFDIEPGTQNYKYAGIRDNGNTRTLVIGQHDAQGFHDKTFLTEDIVTTVSHTYTDGNLQQVVIGTIAFPDTDDDGLPDNFEVLALIGSDPFNARSPLDVEPGTDTNNATGPADDGISDALEQALIDGGATAPITVVTDTDGDGTPDVTEVFNGRNPFEAIEIDPIVSKLTIQNQSSIPLGNLFDDLRTDGISLGDAIQSNAFRAEANFDPATNEGLDLGVDYVRLGGSNTGAINSAGLTFDLSDIGWLGESAGGVANDALRATALNDSPGIQTTRQPLAASGKIQEGIGMHANSLITFDLAEIRRKGALPADEPFRFLSEQAGLNDTAASPASIYLAVLLSTDTEVLAGYVNGRIVDVSGGDFDVTGIGPLTVNDRLASFDVPIPGAATYLTLISADAAISTIESDHGVWSGPIKDALRPTGNLNPDDPSSPPLQPHEGPRLVRQLVRGEIVDLNVRMEIDHPDIAQLDITLVGPDPDGPSGPMIAPRVKLVQQQSVSGDQLLGTKFDSDAVFPLSDGVNPFAGTFKPAEPLTVFNGIDPQGEWRLEITDSDEDPATATLGGWSLELITIDSRDDRTVRPATTRTITVTAKSLVDDPTMPDPTATLRVDVLNDAPEIELSGPDQAYRGLEYTLALGDPTDPVQGDLDTVGDYLISWGDGETEIVPKGTTSAKHTYQITSTDRELFIFVSLIDRDGLHTAAGFKKILVNPLTSDLIVNDEGDIVDNDFEQLTLREAVLLANAIPGSNTIGFANNVSNIQMLVPIPRYRFSSRWKSSAQPIVN